MTETAPAAGTTNVMRYRKNRRVHAATALSFIVSIVVVLGGYEAMNALNVRASARTSSILPITRDVLRDRIGAVLDDRLSDERLKAMLGVDPAAAKQKDRQSALAKVAAQAGHTVDAPQPGPDYAVKYFKTRSGDLADELTNRIDTSTVKDLGPCAMTDQSPNPDATCYVAGNRESELRAIRNVMEASVRKSLTVKPSDSAPPIDVVNRWAEEVVKDAGVERVWRDAKYTDKTAAFLVRALDPPTLPAAVAKRVAAAVSVHTVDAAAAAPAARGLASRLTWGVTAIVFIGLWTAAILMAAWQLWTLLPSGFASLTLGVGTVLAVGAGWCAYNFTSGPETLALLGPLLQRLEHEAGTEILWLSRVFEAMTASAIVLLLLAGSASTWNAKKETVEAHLEGVRTIFNVAAAMLVAQSIQIAALYGWPAATLEHAQSTTGPLGTTALLRAGLAGALFSVALMIVYMPAVSVLRAVARADGDANAEELLDRQGASDSGMQLFLRLLQALSPLLAAVPISGLLSLLGG
jgi:hypothetical protein